MTSFVDALRVESRSVRDSVLADLAEHYDMTPEQARQACLKWEETSVDEWRSTNASDSDAGRVEFYRTTQSWSFDLSWWAYLQAEGRATPSNVMALRFTQQYAPGRRHLDFGSGIGVTSQLFARNGWSSTSADLSSTLLDFARFRHKRRGDDISYIDLHTEKLPAARTTRSPQSIPSPTSPTCTLPAANCTQPWAPTGSSSRISTSEPPLRRRNGTCTTTTCDRSTTSVERGSCRSARSATEWWATAKSPPTGSDIISASSAHGSHS